MAYWKTLFAKCVDRTTRVAADWLEETRTREQNLGLVRKSANKSKGLDSEDGASEIREVCERLLETIESGASATYEPPSFESSDSALVVFQEWIAELPKRAIVDSKRLHPESGTRLLSVASSKAAVHDPTCRSAFEVLLRHLELRRLPAGIEFMKPLDFANHWRECGRAVSALVRYARISEDARYLNAALKLTDRIAAAHDGRFRVRSMSWSTCLGILECEIALDELRTRIISNSRLDMGASN